MGDPIRHPACVPLPLCSGHGGPVLLVPPEPHLLRGGHRHPSPCLQAPVGSTSLPYPMLVWVRQYQNGMPCTEGLGNGSLKH